MQIEIHNNCSDFATYRAARVKSLFNVESGADFHLSADLPIENDGWKIGLIVGPSGSGKTSLGKQIFGAGAVYNPGEKDWPHDLPIVDGIAPDGNFDKVTAAFSAVGLGSVPSWLRPYHVLSNGEKFRANLARLLCEAPSYVVLDEFTSVIDRQVAKVGALAFAKSWRRLPTDEGGFNRQIVLLSCHYDVVEWLEPDWIFDTATGKYAGRGLQQRPQRPAIELEIRQTGWEYWPMFEPHHYLKLPKMIAATNYVGFVEGKPIAHIAFSTRPGLKEARAARFCVLPEWQGIGIGSAFLNHLCERWRLGLNRYEKPMPTLFHTSHPGLCATFRRNPKWVQLTAVLVGENKARSAAQIQKSSHKFACPKKAGHATGYGGHFRAIQGFRYIGSPASEIG